MQQKISNKVCPDNMTIEEWQIALRKQNANASNFEVKHMDNNRIWGDYNVQNNNGSYKVAFRGVRSDRNYCSCLDFRTNGLGTCKHIESVLLFLQKQVPGYPWGEIGFNPDYTSIYVSYKGGRSIKIRVGNKFVNEFNSLKKEYFDENDTLPESRFELFDEIYEKAMNISITTKIYDDVKDFVKEIVDKRNWEKDLERAYPNKSIPWDKQKSNEQLSKIEKSLYDITKYGSGLIVCNDTNNLPHLVARLSEEVYQGEAGNNEGYIIADNDEDIVLYKEALSRYSESNSLPICVISSKRFIDIYANEINGQKVIPFIYILNSDCLKEWKNQLSIILKKLNFKHLYMNISSLRDLSSVQLSSILQHISPFVIGPFYKFIHKHRNIFPLDDTKESLPDEMKNVVFIIKDDLLGINLSDFSDINKSDNLSINSETNYKSQESIDRLIALFKEVVNDKDALNILIRRLEKY